MNLSALTYLSTFLLGLLHAFEPGHGKSFLAAFSLRKNTGFAPIFVMIVSLLSSHFLMLSVIAFLIQFIFSNYDIKTLTQPLQWGAPILVIFFGGYLLYKALKHKHADECGCGHDHHHNHHDATLKGDHIKTASFTGIIAGLIPCPSSVTPLILAGLDNSFSSSLLYILAYVVGMSIALLTFVSILSLAKSYFIARLDNLGNKLSINVISACFIILIGIGYLIYNILENGHHHA